MDPITLGRWKSNSSSFNKAQNMARELGCPYSDKDLRYTNHFLQQLNGIKRANELGLAMGVGPIDFNFSQQSIAEYLEEQDAEENRELMEKCVCAWLGRVYEVNKRRAYKKRKKQLTV